MVLLLASCPAAAQRTPDHTATRVSARVNLRKL